MNSSKLPPQAPELEQAVLGAILLEKEAFGQVEHILTPQDFYVPANGIIYQAISNLTSSNHPVDMLTVTEELKRMKQLDECGGPYYISQLTSKLASTSHLEYHAFIVKEKSHARSLIHLALKLADDLYQPGVDIYQVQEDFEQQFTQLVIGANPTEVVTLGEALQDAVQQAARLEEQQKEGKQVAIPTGLEALDKALDGGWRAPDLAVFGSRPSMGKTQFALWFAKVAAAHDNKVLIASIEMGSRALAGRYLMEDDRVDPSHFRSGQMEQQEWEAIEETAGKIWNLPIYIAADHTIRHLSNIRAQARKMKRQGGLDLLIIDYLGLMKAVGQHAVRYLELGEITSELKNLAKELDIPIILLSQLSRPAKGHIISRPKMEDLRESGNIEQDADVVILLHKPDIHDPDSRDSSGKSWKNRGQLLLLKQRDGTRGITIEYQHDERYKNIRTPSAP